VHLRIKEADFNGIFQKGKNILNAFICAKSINLCFFIYLFLFF